MTADVHKEAKEKDKTSLHPDVHSAERPQSTDVHKFTGNGRKKSKDIKPQMKPSGWTCGECLQWFSDRESYVSHVKTNHGKVRLHDSDPPHLLVAFFNKVGESVFIKQSWFWFWTAEFCL